MTFFNTNTFVTKQEFRKLKHDLESRTYEYKSKNWEHLDNPIEKWFKFVYHAVYHADIPGSILSLLFGHAVSYRSSILKYPLGQFKPFLQILGPRSVLFTHLNTYNIAKLTKNMCAKLSIHQTEQNSPGR